MTCKINEKFFILIKISRKNYENNFIRIILDKNIFICS
jgi:hypothetical protein